MTKQEAMRLTHQENTLMSLGFTHDEANKLRRISMTLRRWHEKECGIDNGCIERDEVTGKAYWLSSHTGKRYPVRDAEAGARRRLGAIVQERNRRVGQNKQPHETWNTWAVSEYIQGDPRGAALYIIRPGDIPAGQTADSCYSRGVCVY